MITALIEQRKKEGKRQRDSTYVIIPILRQKRNPLSRKTIRLRSQALLRPEHIPNEIAVGEGPARDAVHDGGAGRVVVPEGAEQGEVGEGRERAVCCRSCRAPAF